MVRKRAFISLLLLFPFLAACDRGAVNIGSSDGDSLGAEKYGYTFPKGGKVTDEKNGAEVFFAYGALSGTEGTAANGVLQLHVFENGSSLFTVQANLPLLPEGQFYEAWIRKAGGGEPKSIGHVVSRIGDARHALSARQNSDIRDFTDVLITIEKDDGDPSPGKPAALGMVKQVKRPG